MHLLKMGERKNEWKCLKQHKSPEMSNRCPTAGLVPLKQENDGPSCNRVKRHTLILTFWPESDS